MTHYLLQLAGFLTLLSIFLVVYHHAFYPLLLKRLAQRKSRDVQPSHAESLAKLENHPFIDVIIPAFNEEKTIKEKLYNLACIDYPEDKIAFHLVLDGCTDNTEAITQQTLSDPLFENWQFHIHAHKDNAGKVARLNAYATKSKAELIAFSDVSALISCDAFTLCAKHFTDKKVGVVTGYYRLLAPATQGEKAYWDFQCQQQLAESAMGAVQGAHGAFYAIRSELYTPLPADTINDDFIIPMQIVAAGFQAIMEPNINALELEQTTNELESHRRIRIAAGNTQQLFRLHHLLHPRYRNIAFMFASGKTLRVLMPYLMLISLLGSALLAPLSTLFLLAFAGQVSGYLMGVLSLCNFPYSQKFSPLGYLVRGHYCSLLGSSRYLWDALHGKHRAVLRHKARNNDNDTFFGIDRTTAKAKRIFDIVIAGSALVMLSPLLPLLVLAIKLESRGPAIFSQVRIGLCTPTQTQYFTMYKFRSMVQDAEKATGATLAQKNDTRITRVGLFLRKTRLDEIPQLINVLRGDMSIVGPRPERPDFYGKLEKAIPFFAERTYGVMPGITGLAQVHQGYDTCIEDVRSKVGYDHGYALSLHNISTWLRMDLWIMFKTIEVMIMGRGQ